MGERVVSYVLTLLCSPGWGMVVIIIAACLLAAFNSIRLGQCWDILQQRYPEYKEHIRDPYPTIAERAVGKWMRYIAKCTVIE